MTLYRGSPNSRFSHWTQWRTKAGKLRFAFAWPANGRGGGYRVEIRNAEFQPRGKRFTVASYKALRAALKRRGADV